MTAKEISIYVEKFNRTNFILATISLLAARAFGNMAKRGLFMSKNVPFGRCILLELPANTLLQTRKNIVNGERNVRRRAD